MKTILYSDIVSNVAEMCQKACTILPEDVLSSLRSAVQNEKSKLAGSLLNQCIKNAEIAKNEGVPICQDTGFAVYFVEIGSEVHIEGGTIQDALNEGTAKGYTEGYLRKSIVADPLFDRKNTTDNTPAVIHLEMVPGDTIQITMAPKGGGSENMSSVAMLKPSDGEPGIIDFVVGTVVKAGGNPCPPTIVGVGIGGSFEKCTLLAKKALLRQIGESHPDKRYAELERRILEKINASGIGPQGLGGSTTALAVHIETFPCHIASLPVAVNLNCHAARHVEITISGQI